MRHLVLGQALFRLLARPAAWLFGFFWLANTMWMSEWVLQSHATLLFPYLMPLPAGFMLGQVIQELQHTTFGWMLPRLRSALITPLLAISFCACALTMLAMAHSTRLAISAIALAPLPFAALSFLGFCVGLAMVNRGLAGVMQLGLGAAVGAWAYATRQLGPGASLVVSVLAAAGGVGCLGLLWSTPLLRRRSLEPALTMATSQTISATEAFRHQKLARRNYRGADWTVDLAGAGTALWVQAAVYARHGFRRLRWYGAALTSPIMSAAVLFLLCRGFVHILEWTENVRGVGAMLWHPTSLQHVSLGLGLIWVAGPALGGGTKVAWSGLSPYLHYPLSRAQRLRVEYLMQLSAVAVSAMVSLLVLGGLVWLSGGTNISDSPARFPGFVPPVVVVLSAMPFLLWRDTRLELPEARRGSPAVRTIVSVLIALGLAVAAALASAAASHSLALAPPLVGIIVCLGLLALSQGLFWRLLVHVHTKGDLI